MKNKTNTSGKKVKAWAVVGDNSHMLYTTIPDYRAQIFLKKREAVAMNNGYLQCSVVPCTVFFTIPKKA